MFHFGLLREMEAILVEKKDVVVKNDHADEMFDHPIKRRFKGFM